ncbi:probable WRKY transcription factor 32 [Tanacetum coccineum]
MAWAGIYQPRTYGTTSGVVGTRNVWAVVMARSHQLTNHLQGSHQEALATIIAQAHSESEIKSSSTGLSVMPVTLSPKRSDSQIDTHVAEANQKETTDPKSLPAVETPDDSYTWRKYGQKQVKSPGSSRGYYKCSYGACDAKKFESYDQFNSVTKIVYKGQHKHDPPKKVVPKGDEILSTPESLKRKTTSTSSLKENQSSGCAPIQIVHIDDSQVKPRYEYVPKHPKKPKFSVQVAADLEISADGYRWRKYGQKMVKGTPHPRNYYKCISAGCPVRKHIENAVDGSPEVTITYKGLHDHNMPVPRKGQGPPSDVLVTAVSSASKNISQPTSRESARTLLSVGFEIKQC